MPISLHYDASKGIIYTSRTGEVTQQQRVQAIKELALMSKQSSLLLVDGR